MLKSQEQNTIGAQVQRHTSPQLTLQMQAWEIVCTYPSIPMTYKAQIVATHTTSYVRAVSFVSVSKILTSKPV